jgi:hypothetical protein
MLSELPAKIVKLSDEFGQYLIFIECRCRHSRCCYPQTLQAIAGWDARLDAMVKRIRCSKCNERKCTARTVSLALDYLRKPDS